MQSWKCNLGGFWKLYSVHTGKFDQFLRKNSKYDSKKSKNSNECNQKALNNPKFKVNPTQNKFQDVLDQKWTLKSGCTAGGHWLIAHLRMMLHYLCMTYHCDKNAVLYTCPVSLWALWNIFETFFSLLEKSWVFKTQSCKTLKVQLSN